MVHYYELSGRVTCWQFYFFCPDFSRMKEKNTNVSYAGVRMGRYNANADINVIQIAPIKINPWSWVAKCIHDFLFGDIDRKLDSLSAKVDKLEEQSEEDKAIQARSHILRFADECYSGKEHSHEYFLQILDTIKIYEKFCNDHPIFSNGRTEKSCEIIKTTYDKVS